MTLPSSGALSFSQIQSEFGGSNPIGLNEYYRGGANVPSHGNTTGIPSSGQISVSQFYGKSNQAPGVSSFTYTVTCGSSTILGTKGYSTAQSIGSYTPNQQSLPLTSGFNPTWYAFMTQNTCKSQVILIANGNVPNSGFSNVTINSLTNGGNSQARTSLGYSYDSSNNRSQWTYFPPNTNSEFPASGTVTVTFTV